MREMDQALAGGAAHVLHRLADRDADDGPPCPAAEVRDSHLTPAMLPGIGADPLYMRLVWAGTGRTAALSPDPMPQAAFVTALQSLPPIARGPVFTGQGDDDRMRCLTVAVPHSPYLLQVAAPWDPAEDPAHAPDHRAGPGRPAVPDAFRHRELAAGGPRPAPD